MIVLKKVYLWILLLLFIFLSELGVFNTFVHLLLSKYYFFKGEQAVKSSFVHLQIPTNWFISYQDKILTKLSGPPLDQYTNQYMTTFKDENESIKSYFYIEPKFCQSKVENINITNEIFFHNKHHTDNSQFESSIVFCEKPDFGEPYAALFNKGTMSIIIIKPYQKANKDMYVELFKSLKFDAYIDELPMWLKNE